MSEYLLVPTNLQAYVVGKAGDEVYDLAPVPRDETEVAHWYVDQYGKRSPRFDSKKRPAPGPGVHLHWALPVALTRSRHRGDGAPEQPLIPNRSALTRSRHPDDDSPEQPLIPNRWVVVRMWRRADKRSPIAARAWVLESDYVSLTATSDNTPFLFLGTNQPAELNGRICGYVGRAQPLPDAGWRETQEEYRFELKSSGWGDPSFASYYPACKGVLGFHDTMEGVQKDDRVTYLVAGWYSDPAADPLRATTPPDTVKEFTKRLASLGWSYPSPDRLDARELPRRTLCLGRCVGITWPGAGAEVPAAPAGGRPTIAIGGTAAEALIAMLDAAQPNPDLQQVLCAFQLGQAAQVADLDQLADLLHRHSFSAVAGGTFWTVNPEAEPAAVTNGQAADPSQTTAKPPPPLSANVQALLGKLNQAQDELDRHARRVESLRGRFFACWATWASKQTGPPANRPLPATVEPALADLKKALGDTQYEQVVKEARSDVENALKAESTRMQLAETTRPPFLQPKDPFVVLKADDLLGVDRVWPQRPASDAHRPSVLDCRLDGDVVTGVELSGTVSARREAEDVLPLAKTLGAVGTLPLRKLALETLLLDPNCADLISTEDADLLKRLQTSLKASESSSGNVNTLSWAGMPPDPLSVTRWDRCNPWLPVYLFWQASWWPAYASGPDPNYPSGPLADWELDAASGQGARAGDLVRKPVPVGARNPEVTLEGATLISALSSAALARNLLEFATVLGPKISLDSSDTFLGQSLGGFNDLLLRQALGLCLPPFDPTQKQGPAQVDMTIWGDVGWKPQAVMPVVPPDGGFAPGSSPFLPVRAGDLKLVTLYVVDCFGQTRRLIDRSTSSTVVASATLPKPQDGYHVRFSPRLVQPARLNFAWTSAGTASVGPVCGWIVPNYLEKSFAVFSAAGEPLGALESVLPALGNKTINSPMRFRWRAIPGSTLKIEAIGNSALRRFVTLATKLTADEGQTFLELVELVLRRTEGRVPPEDPAVSVLLGRPLAVVQVSLGLEVEGLPAGYWYQPRGVKSFAFETEHWEELRVPVRLGGMSLPSDGLVGYLTQPESESEPPCLFASDGAIRRPGSDQENIRYDQHRTGSRADPKPLSLSYADPKPLSLTLLMDARARVHAATGLLPRHQISLPAEAARLASLIEEFYVGVAPVLGRKPSRAAAQPAPGEPLPAVTMPQPSDAFGQWSWATRPNLTAWQPIRPADDRARFADNLALIEGHLRLTLKKRDSATA